MPRKAKLIPGAELEMPTADEIAAELRTLIGRRPPDDLQTGAQGQTTAGGALTAVVYVVPAGKRFVLTRTIVEAAGYTPAAPYNAPGAYLRITRNGQTVDFLSLVAGSGGSLPAISTDSDDSGPVFKNGDELAVELVGGPATTDILVSIRGILREPLE